MLYRFELDFFYQIIQHETSYLILFFRIKKCCNIGGVFDKDLLLRIHVRYNGEVKARASCRMICTLDRPALLLKSKIRRHGLIADGKILYRNQLSRRKPI